MNDQQLIKEIYEKCRYNISLTAEDLDPVPKAFEYGQLRGVHDTAYEVLALIDKQNSKDAS